MNSAKARQGLFAAVLAFALAAIASMFVLTPSAQADYIPATDTNLVNPNYLFDTGIKLNPEADTAGFTITITDSNGAAVNPPSGFVRVASNAAEDNQPYRSKDAWTSTHYMFMHDNAGRTADTVAFWFDDPAALDGATVHLTYPNIGTYYGTPVGMAVDISGIEFMRHPFSEAIMHAGNSKTWTWDDSGAINGLAEGSAADTYVAGPAMIVSTLPQYGIFQWNIHQDDFMVSFFESDDASRTPLSGMEDIYLTFNSLSVYPLSLKENPVTSYPESYLHDSKDSLGDTTIMQHEKVKALSNLQTAYVTTDTHVYRGDANGGARANNDRYTALGELGSVEVGGKTYYTSTGEIVKNGKSEPDHGYTTSTDAEAWPYYWTESGEYYYDGVDWVQAGTSDIADPNAYNDRMGTSLFTRNSVSLQYADSSDIRFRMNTPDNSFWYSLYPQALTAAVPGRPEIEVAAGPHKGVAATAAEAATGSKDALVGDTVTYKVSQLVNSIGQDASVRYTNLQIVAEIPEGVVLDDAGAFKIASSASPAPQGTFAVEGNTVTYTFDTAYLSDEANGMPMMGETYTLTITGKIAEAAKGKTISASAKTILNNPTSTDTDDASVTNPGRVAFSENPAELKVSAQDAKATSLTLANRNDTFTFVVEKLIPADAATVSFQDTLEPVLEVVGTPTIDGKAQYDVVVDGNNNTVTASTADATADREQLVTLAIQAKVRDGVTDADLVQYVDESGAFNVPNTARVTINNNPLVSNTVVVTPPPTPDADKPPIEKKVTTSVDAANSIHGDLAALDEVYTYTIETQIPANAKGFKVADTIDDILAFVGEPIVTLDGAEVPGVATVDSQTLTVAFGEDQVASSPGKPVVVTFNAKIAVSDDELVAKYADRTVPNKASYTITNADGTDQEPVDSNTVTVTPPTPDDGTDGNDPNNNPNNDPNKGSVVVEHRTTDGKVLKPWTDVVRNVDGGTPYTTNPENFEGYRFVEVSKDFDPANGEVEAGTTKQVVYLYEPISDDDGTGGNDPNNNPNRDDDGNGGNNNPNGGNNNPNGGNTTPPARPTTPAGGARTLSQTADAASFATLALGTLAVAAFGAGAYSLRRSRTSRKK